MFIYYFKFFFLLIHSFCMKAVAFKWSFFLNCREREKESERERVTVNVWSMETQVILRTHPFINFNTLMIPIYVKMHTKITLWVVLIHFIFDALLFSISTSCKSKFMEFFFHQSFFFPFQIVLLDG